MRTLGNALPPRAAAPSQLNTPMPDPTLRAPTGAAELLLALGIIVIALLPFADRRGIER